MEHSNTPDPSDPSDQVKPSVENKDEIKSSAKNKESKKKDTTQIDEVNPTDIRALRKRVNEIESEVQNWRDKREILNSKVIEKAKIRNDKNGEVRALIALANAEKKLRDEANEEIKLN